MAGNIVNTSVNVERRKMAMEPALITLNTTASTKLLNANPYREYFSVTNTAATGISLYVKLQDTSVDDDKKGRCLDGGESCVMDSNVLYTGEVCAIAVSDSPKVSVVEY